MEVRRTSIFNGLRILLCSILLVLAVPVYAQPPVKSYSVKDGSMVITLSKHLPAASLDSFVLHYDLADLDLPRLINTGNTDSLEKLGWNVDAGKRDIYQLRKPLNPAGNLNNPADVILFTHDSSASQLPVNQVHFGFNRFKGKTPFVVSDSVVSFLLRGYAKASRVELAGSFTNWQHGAYRMQQSEDGWVIAVKLLPGKHLYKFIVDGNWMIDRENALVENDGLGNDNSVYFKTNYTFRLTGYTDVKRLFLAGSFNNWQERALPMQRTANGWEVPVYLSEGTHTYRYIADGRWFVDPANPDRLPNEYNDFNSVLRLGKPYVFKLDGFADAKKVTLVGSFNNWKEDELFLKQTATGWEMPYTLGAGNYEYKLKVDGRYAVDPITKDNFVLIIQPNYTFRLKGYTDAKKVCLAGAGSINNWNPESFRMKREGEEWVFNVHLNKGKHLYKFVVDGKWMVDPSNPLWEGNQYGTNDSILWVEGE